MANSPSENRGPGEHSPRFSGDTQGEHCAPEPAASTQEHSRTARDEAKAAWDETKAGAKHAAESVKAKGASLGEEARTAAHDTAERAKRESRDFVNCQKDQAAEELSHFESAMRRASEQLRDEHDDRIAGFADAAADKVGAMAQYLRERDLSNLVDDLEGAARRRPELFFGGMLLVGVAAARFLKASSQSRRQPTAGSMEPRPTTALSEPVPAFSTNDFPHTTDIPQSTAARGPESMP